MARKIEFDYDKAIDKATRKFWQNGYSNTSLRELLKVMEIGEGSFYNAFKSKNALYLLCLKHYNDKITIMRLSALLSGTSVKDGIRAFFKTVLDDLDDPATPRVCLMAGSLSSDVLAEGDLAQYVVGEMTAFLDCFKQRIYFSIEVGELPSDFNVDIVAQVFVTYLQGLFRVIRVLQNREETERQIEALLKGLGL